MQKSKHYPVHIGDNIWVPACSIIDVDSESGVGVNVTSVRYHYCGKVMGVTTKTPVSEIVRNWQLATS